MLRFDDQNPRFPGVLRVNKNPKPACHRTGVALLFAMASVPPLAAAEEQGSALDALTKGQLDFGFRYRFEDVEQDNALDNAQASVLRSRATYTTMPLSGWQAQVEVDNHTVLGDDEDYNSTSNGQTTRSVIADPEGTEFNQAWVSWSRIPRTAIKAGRQRLVYDNERFIGTAGWRQNEQTFDGVTVTNTSIRKTSLNYAHISNVNRVFGPDDGTLEQWKGDWESDIDLFNASYAPSISGGDGFSVPLGLITAYYYLMDIEAADAQSTKTAGLRWAGKYPVTDMNNLLFTLEYATQEDYGDNPVGFEADYYTLELGITLPHAIVLGAGAEVLGGDRDRAGRAFRTPLGSLHKFQGFADVFTTTPGPGIDDRYVNGQITVLNNTVIAAAWHDYQAEDGGDSWGDEINITVTRRFSALFIGMLKYADYHADNFAVDTRKWWVQIQYDF
jgi:hypothetical protein